MAGDVCTTAKDFPGHIEAKRTQGWDFEQLLSDQDRVPGELGKHIEQVISESPPHKIPMLWLSHPGPSQPLFVMVFSPIDGQPRRWHTLLDSTQSVKGLVTHVSTSSKWRYWILNYKILITLPQDQFV